MKASVVNSGHAVHACCTPAEPPHHHVSPEPISSSVRAAFARRGRQLEVLTVVWAAIEAGVALTGAYREHSVSLAGFGWDSCIEMLSGAALYWRMTHEMDSERKHQAEKLSLTVAGVCLFSLAAYVLIDSVRALFVGGDRSHGWMGIVITAAALVSMPLLTAAKRKVAVGLNSRAMMADAAQTNFCAIQAAIVLSGLFLSATFHIVWADAVAGLVLVPFLIRAGRAAFRGEDCCSH